ncbi:Uncharacterised protein [Mycobacteroides abscessus]|nr:Uncharacterised protein [Mycobacteroides abscessus]
MAFLLLHNYTDFILYFRIIFEYSHFYWLSNSYIASYFCIFGNLCIFFTNDDSNSLLDKWT